MERDLGGDVPCQMATQAALRLRPLGTSNTISVPTNAFLAGTGNNVGGKGDITDTHLIWKDDKAVPKESSPIIVDDLIYLNVDKGVLSCFVAATGEELYRERLEGQGGYSASPVYAGGHLFFHNGSGITTVVKPGRTFTKVAENSLGEAGLSSFAVVSDGFVIRTEGHLVLIGE